MNTDDLHVSVRGVAAPVAAFDADGMPLIVEDGVLTAPTGDGWELHHSPCEACLVMREREWEQHRRRQFVIDSARVRLGLEPRFPRPDLPPRNEVYAAMRRAFIAIANSETGGTTAPPVP